MLYDVWIPLKAVFRERTGAIDVCLCFCLDKTQFTRGNSNNWAVLFMKVSNPVKAAALNGFVGYGNSTENCDPWAREPIEWMEEYIVPNHAEGILLKS